MKRKFWHCSKSPHGAFVMKAFDNADDCIVIGTYDDEGGCEYEFNILWRNGVAELLVYADCWLVLTQFKDLIDRMALVDERVTPDQFCKILLDLGITE
jgi:hypothetical protein